MGKADQLFSQFNKEFKTELCTKGIVINKCDRIPFSSPRANYMLYGGIPRGRLTEFAGEEGGGKTTTSFDIVGNAQKLFKKEYEEKIAELEAIEKPNKSQANALIELRDAGPKRILWVDCENTFDEEWATKLGVNVPEMDFMLPQSQSAEQIFEMVIQLIDTGEFGLVVIDSLGCMMSSQAYEKTLEERTYGGIAMALTAFSKKAEMSCARTNCALIGINQLRDDLNSMFGGTTTTGGRGWKHHCSVRLMFRKGDYFDEKGKKLARNCESPSGNLVQISVTKTKVCKPTRRQGFYTLKYDTGIDAMNDLVELGIKYDVIHQGGAWFTFVNPFTGEVMCNTDEDGEEEVYKVQGQANVVPFLLAHEDIYNMLKEYIDTKIEND